MKLPLLIVGMITALALTVGAVAFDEYGVWEAASGVAILAGNTSIYGPVSAYERDKIINIGLYGSTAGDSLKFTIQLFGGFSYNLSDSAKFRLLKSTGIVRQVNTNKNYAVADTIEYAEQYPYLILKLTNNHAASSGTFDLNVYMRERTVNPIRLR